MHRGRPGYCGDLRAPKLVKDRERPHFGGKKQGITLVLGASLNPTRTSYTALQKLQARDIPVVAVGRTAGQVGDIEIVTGTPVLASCDTISMYISREQQPPLYEYIFSCNPRRLIFNPGTENQELASLAKQRGIEVEVGCMLVMLAIGTF